MAPLILTAALVGAGLIWARLSTPPDESVGSSHAAGETAPLDRYLLQPWEAGQSDSALALLRAALTAREAGDVSLARRRFEEAGVVLPAFADWAGLLAADAAARAGDTTAVRRLLAGMDAELARDRGWRAVVRAYREARNVTGAATAAAAAQPLPVSERVDAWVTQGELRLMLADSDAARAAFRLATDSFPTSTRAVDAARRLASMSGLTLDDRARIGRVYLHHGNIPRALSNLDAYLDGRGGTSDTRNALRLEIGKALMDRRENQSAEKRMLALAALRVDPALAAEALLIAGRAQYREGRTTQGRATLERAVERVGGRGAIAADALFVLGDMAHDDGRLDDARDLYGRASIAAPATARGHEAAVRYGALAYLRGDMDAAARTFAGTPGEGERRQRLDYWTARAQREIGDSTAATSLLKAVMTANPLSYYGMRAAEQLSAPAPTLSAGASDDRTNSARLRNAIERYELLLELGLDDAASYELGRLQRQYDEEREVLYALADALHEKGEHLRAVLIGRALQRNGAPEDARLLRIINPFPYRDLIEREARRNGLDPYFVVALMRQESLFNPQARSGPGAIGLMQVMPATGKAIARRLGIEGFTPEMLTDPEVNIRIGTVILADHLRSYGGRIHDVLIAYNAGAGRLSRWREFPERGDADLFIERIPYDETRDYVRIVRTNAWVYRALYGEVNG